MTDTKHIRSAKELVEFVEAQTSQRGWGRGLRTAISEWYMNQPVAKLAEEVAPDLERHRYIIRRAHPKPRTLAHNAFFQWVTTGELGHSATPEIRAAQLLAIDAMERLEEARDLNEAVRLVEEFRLAPELVPAKWKESARVWEALLGHMSTAALVSNLRPMADAGVFREPMVAAVVVSRLSRLADGERAQIEALRCVEALAPVLAAVA